MSSAVAGRKFTQPPYPALATKLRDVEGKDGTKSTDRPHCALRHHLVRKGDALHAGRDLPAPFGGKSRQVIVDLDQHALQGLGLAPNDVVNAITAQNLTEPSGPAKIGSIQYPMELNATANVGR